MESPEPCYICFDEEDVAVMACGHTLHEECAQQQLATLAKPGEKFNTTPAACGYCRQWLSHETLDPLVAPTKTLFCGLCKNLVVADVVPGLKEAHQNVLSLFPLLTKKTTDFPINFLDDYVFFSCFSCSKVYYGGGKDCQAGMSAGGKKENRLCPTCVAKALDISISPCKTHGIEYCAFKCKFCCTVANWFNGASNYCEKCNQKSTTPSDPPVPQDCSCKVVYFATLNILERNKRSNK